MEKLRLGKTEMMVTRLGFGGIPIQRVTEEEAVAVVRRCLDLGINYLDTAAGYGASEERIGKAIAGRKREEFHIATKSFPGTAQDLNDNLNRSLGRLGVAYVDLYQIHNIGSLGILDDLLGPSPAMQALQEAKQAGKVRHIGFSTHNIHVAKAGIRSGLFETCMFPFNFIVSEAADELLPLAKEHDVGFVAIKAFSGGRLDDANICLKYLFQFPEMIVLPGIEKPHEIEEIVRILEKPEMTPAERETMQQQRASLTTRFCRHCDECMPCPQGVPVTMVMDYEGMVKSIPRSGLYEGRFAELLAKAAACDDCGDCNPRCPYGLKVSSIILEYVRHYEAGKREYEAELKG